MGGCNPSHCGRWKSFWPLPACGLRLARRWNMGIPPQQGKGCCVSRLALWVRGNAGHLGACHGGIVLTGLDICVPQAAYVIAHPACGTRELWRAFQASDAEGVTDQPPDPEWTQKSNKDRQLAVTDHVLDEREKTFAKQGRMERALLDYHQSPYISVFHREEAGGSAPQASTPKRAAADASTPSGPLSTGVASLLSAGSSSSTRQPGATRSRPAVARGDEVVRSLEPSLR